MKKLMIAFGAVALATAVNAATANWSIEIPESSAICLPSESVGVDGFGYLFLTDSVEASDVLDAFLSDPTSVSSLAAAGAFTVENGQIAKTTFDGPEAATSYFLAVVSGKNLFIDLPPDDPYNYNEKTGGIVSTDTSWSNDPTYDYRGETSFVDYGWYAAAVPEPTSGLLLLLGVAGLALRRRRA